MSQLIRRRPAKVKSYSCRFFIQPEIYRMYVHYADSRRWKTEMIGATGGVTDKAIVDKMLAKYREDYK